MGPAKRDCKCTTFFEKCKELIEKSGRLAKAAIFFYICQYKNIKSMLENQYQLDAHCQAILEEYREHTALFEQAAQTIVAALKKVFDQAGQFNGRPMLAFFIIIWASDVGAYCIGMFLGKYSKKLFPSVSPKKTWAGFWGGLVFAVLAGLILVWTGLWTYPWYHAVILSIIMHVAGVFGDLFESQWKRVCDIKDSGNIIPGHGGMMDRFDSALFAIPAGVIYLVIIGLL